MYLFSKKIDLLLLFAPVWLTWIILFLLPDSILLADIPPWVWFLLVVGIDVSHVWSSLFRTYFDAHDRVNHGYLIKALPFLVLFFAFAVSYSSIGLFWRLMAYLALFHFVKQQFGFMVLYAIKNGTKGSQSFRWDKYLIYFGMIYPVVYWHLNPDLHFSWFVADDFVLNRLIKIPSWFFNLSNALYGLVFIYWFYRKIKLGKKEFNNQLPMILWILSTAANWYIGIVYFNSDLAFTATNVVAHGIPYMVLIAFYKKKKDHYVTNKNRSFVSVAIIVVFVCLFFGIFEEYWWEVLINKDKKTFFSSFTFYLDFDYSSRVLKAFFIGLLSVPQITHYILDGFIWKNNESNPFLKLMFKA